MKILPSIRDCALENKAVFMRLDLNVPLKNGTITSEARIVAALPTIKHALAAGARVAVASHLGRPKGGRDASFSLEPVAACLSRHLGQDVILADDCVGDGVKGILRDLRPGGLMMLENLRFQKGETQNDADLSRQLAAPFDVYINDAFGASHRAHASIVGMVRYFETRAAGFLLEKEVVALSRLLHEPQKPFVAVVGGAKVADKVGVLEALMNKVSTLCVGGAMAYTFLKARGVEVGTSRVEEDKLRLAREIMQRAKTMGVTFLLPSDHVAAKEFSENATPVRVAAEALPSDLMGLDIGPQSQERFGAAIATAKTVFWNGPMGVFEWEKFAAGTGAVAQAVAQTQGYTVVGGGDSVAAIEQAGIADRIDHVSTGGGASLELLQFGTLPGIEALFGRFDNK